MPFHYRVHGLRFASDVPLAGAREVAPGPADVTVTDAPPDRDRYDGARFGDEFLVAEDGDALMVTRRGLIEVAGGDTVRLGLDRGASAGFAGMMVFGGVSAALLHQRRAMPLHAACMARDGVAVIFSGDSHAGKSTTTRMFAERGWRLVGDDLLALEVGPDGVFAHASVAFAKLWGEAAGAVSGPSSGPSSGRAVDVGIFPKVVVGMEGVDPDRRIPVRAIHHLEWLHPEGAASEIERLDAMSAVLRLRKAIHRPVFVRALGLEREYMARLGRLAGAVPSFALRRPKSFARLDWLDDVERGMAA